MSSTQQARLEALRVEHARQDEEWGRARRALEALGDARIGVPPEVLEEIDAACTVHADVMNTAAIRG